MDADGEHPVQLTSDNGFETQPEWSADGAHLAYHAKGGNDERVLSMDVATRKADVLFTLATLRPSSGKPPSAAPLGEVRLSRSAKRIAFSVREPPTGGRVLYTATLDPLSTHQMTNASMSVGYPAWSPDERLVAVEIKEGSSTQAAVLDIETGLLRRLSDARGQTWVRSWSPDGRKVAAAVLRNGLWSLRTLDVTDGRERAITPPGPPRVFVRYPDWSARGDLVVFERAEMVGNIWLLERRKAHGT